MILRKGQRFTEPCAAESLREALLSPEVRRSLAGDHRLDQRERRRLLGNEKNVPCEQLTLQTVFSELRSALHAALSSNDPNNDAVRFFNLLDALDGVANDAVRATTAIELDRDVNDVLRMIGYLARELKEEDGNGELKTCLLNVRLRVGELLLGPDYDPIPAQSIDPDSTKGEAFVAKHAASLQVVWGFGKPKPHLVYTQHQATHDQDVAPHHLRATYPHRLGRNHHHHPDSELALVANEN